jgi:hypothetical protein
MVLVESQIEFNIILIEIDRNQNTFFLWILAKIGWAQKTGFKNFKISVWQPFNHNGFFMKIFSVLGILHKQLEDKITEF